MQYQDHPTNYALLRKILLLRIPVAEIQLRHTNRQRIYHKCVPLKEGFEDVFVIINHKRGLSKCELTTNQYNKFIFHMSM